MKNPDFACHSWLLLSLGSVEILFSFLTFPVPRGDQLLFAVFLPHFRY